MKSPHDKQINIGISSCLLGNAVRYDGGQKHNAYITKTLSDYFDFVSFCPEAEAGLGIPRPPIRLVKLDNRILLKEVKDHSKDHTAALDSFCQASSTQQRLASLSGFILKKDSPSCGMERVRVYNGEHMDHPPIREGTGVFAQHMQQHYPWLPMEEEGRLNDPVLRENFIERVFVYQRWREMLAEGMSKKALVNFHSDHKYIIMAHDQNKGQQLGQLVAKTGITDLKRLHDDYIVRLMALLKTCATRGRHANVLSHLMGYIHNELESDDRAELVDMIEQYQQAYVPLIVPITLLKHHFRKHPKPYIERQYYLNPHPRELMLRNQL